tara:strand:+ start:261 stop:467 length:207 start_codon:yes stop_codon:yes gene_type:complete
VYLWQTQSFESLLGSSKSKQSERCKGKYGFSLKTYKKHELTFSCKNSKKIKNSKKYKKAVKNTKKMHR